MMCRLCVTTPKSWSGSDRKCAFGPDGKFRRDNWCCETLRRLRELAETLEQHWSQDYHLLTVPVEDAGIAFIVMCWYKHRGNCTSAQEVDLEGNWSPLTLGTAQRALGLLPVEEQLVEDYL